MAKSIAGLLLLAAVTYMPAQTIDRTKPPVTPDLPVYKLPPVYETTLPNGMRVVLVEDRRLPLVTVRLGFEAGSKFDPKDQAGLAESTGALLTEGTATRSSRQIAEELASIGGTLKAQVTSDSLVVAGNALAENTGRLLEILADVVRNASFPEDEVALRRQNRKQELLAEQSEASFWADKQLAAVVFGSHPYAVVSPTIASLDRLDRAALAGFRDRHLAPNNAVLILLGAIPPREEALRAIRERFGGWERKEVPPAPPAVFPEPKRTVVLVDRPGSVQADIRVGHLAVNRLSPDFFPLWVGNSILGGGASSRMFMNIREKQGFAYDAHSSLQPKKDAGLFEAVTQVRNEVLGQALESVEAELTAMGKTPVSAAELSSVKNYLSGVFVIGLETQAGLAGQLLSMRLMGLPADYLETYTTRIRSVEPPGIQSAAGKYFSPRDAAIVVVGDAAKLKPALEKFGNVTVEKAN